MQRMTPFILLLVLTVSCQGNGESANENFEFINDTHSINDAIPNEALTFDVKVDFVNFTPSQEEKMSKAIDIIKLVIATEEFREKVLNHTYQGAKTFVDNKGYTNAQIYQIILDGAEKLHPVKDNTMNAEVELYYANSNVVGYTYPSTRRIWVNTKYFNNYTPAGVAHNLVHEWLHKLGFEHSSTWNPARSYSVPYAIGNLLGEIGKKFL